MNFFCKALLIFLWSVLFFVPDGMAQNKQYVAVSSDLISQMALDTGIIIPDIIILNVDSPGFIPTGQNHSWPGYCLACGTDYCLFPRLSGEADGKGGKKKKNAIEKHERSVDEKLEDTIPLNVFPNPANHYLNVRGVDRENTIFNLYQLSGRKCIIPYRQYNSMFVLDTAVLKNGSYILEVITNGNRSIQKVQVLH